MLVATDEIGEEIKKKLNVKKNVAADVDEVNTLAAKKYHAYLDLGSQLH